MDVLPPPPSGDSPEYRRLLTAHDLYMQRLSDLIGNAVRPGSTRIEEWMPLALYHHVMQLGRATQELVRAGYSDEALPLGRAMISATMNLLFIVTSGNPAGWSLLYLLQVVETERKMLELQAALDYFDAGTIRQYLDAAKADAESVKAAFIQDGGIIPEKLPSGGRKGKPRRDTWTGLSDAELAEHVQLKAWKESEYDYLSAVTHAQAVAILPFRDAVMDGQPVVLGPHYRPPLPALSASFNAMRFSSLGIISHYELLSLDSQFQALNRDMHAAIDRYREELGALAVVEGLFGEHG
jgi:Family of unknown function (DUF5677)